MKSRILIPIVVLLLALLICIKGSLNSALKSLYIRIFPTESLTSIQEKITVKAKDRLEADLLKIGYEDLPAEICMIALKEEQQLEVYAKQNEILRLIKVYPFTASSGELGPKLREGDKQIPEGLYNIEYLNPNSKYHLSMKINYPNEFDRSKAVLEGRSNLGGDIFIHGKSVTIGCIPIGDKAIEELFLLASHAMNKGIQILISPRDFRIKAERPNVQSVSWENELYDHIEKALIAFDSKVRRQ